MGMELQKAWDKSALIAELKVKGIQDAEKLVQDILDTVLDWSVASCAIEAQTNPIYAIGGMILPELKKQVDAKLQEAAAAAIG